MNIKWSAVGAGLLSVLCMVAALFQLDVRIVLALGVMAIVQAVFSTQE